MTTAKRLNQVPLIFGSKKVNKTHLILATDLRNLIKKVKK